MAEANWLAEFRSLVIRLERALGAGKPAFTANNPVERVARSLSFGLNSRALAVGALIEVPEAAAGAYDCIRSVAEAQTTLSGDQRRRRGTRTPRATATPARHSTPPPNASPTGTSPSSSQPMTIAIGGTR
jgi:hypothetical protein